MDAITDIDLLAGQKATKRIPSASSLALGAGALLIIFGAKIFLISQYGSSIPFWDQWDAEAGFLYKPYFDGTLRFSSLFDTHNEHRMFFPRVLCLGLLLLEQRWDPMLQMIVGAALHVVSVGILLAVLGRELRALPLAMLAAFIIVMFSLPFGWENTLQAFTVSTFI